MNPAPGRPTVKEFAALIGAVLAVSSGSVFARLAHANPLVIAAYRMTFATLMIAPLAVWKSRSELKSLSLRQYMLAVLAGLFLALHFGTWLSSLNYTTIASSVVLVNTIPIWVALFSPWLTRDRLSGRTWCSILLSVAGGVLIGTGDFAVGGQALLGDGLALAGAVCVAVYLLLGRKLRARLSLVCYVTVCYGSAAVLLWCVVLAWRLPMSGFALSTWGALFGMALISQHLGHSGYNYALKYFSASVIAVVLLGEPILASAWAYLFFDEHLTRVKCLGAALILAAIYLAATEPRAD